MCEIYLEGSFIRQQWNYSNLLKAMGTQKQDYPAKSRTYGHPKCECISPFLLKVMIFLDIHSYSSLVGTSIVLVNLS